MSEWIGVDFDGTLAEYHGPGNAFIARPVTPMVERVKKWLEEGKEIRIITARVSSKVEPYARNIALLFIGAFCKKYIGRMLEVTAEKDYEMLELWDDRAVSVETNTGRIRSEQ